MTRSSSVVELTETVIAVLCDADKVLENARAVYGVSPDGQGFLWPFEFIEVLQLEAAGAKLFSGEFDAWYCQAPEVAPGAPAGAERGEGCRFESGPAPALPGRDVDTVHIEGLSS